MTGWLVTLVSLWIYPVIGYLVIHLTRSRLEVRRKIIWVCVSANILAAFGLLTTISTTLPVLDWILVSGFYLTTCTLLWLVCGLQSKVLRVISVITTSCVFGVGYLSGTVGILGVGFVTAEFEPRVEIWLGDGIIYKETPLGNAVSDYRGKRVEVFKTISWLPIVEWRTMKKEYFNVIPYAGELSVDYAPNENKIYLSTSLPWGKDQQIESWADTLVLNR